MRSVRLARASSWGPNAFSALDSLGVGEVARQRAVFTDHITMMDAVNAEEVVRIETGQAFRDHFGGPYAVIHRVDIHASVWGSGTDASGRGISHLHQRRGYSRDGRRCHRV